MIIKHSVSTAEGIKVETLPEWAAAKVKVAKAEAEAENEQEDVKEKTKTEVKSDTEGV